MIAMTPTSTEGREVVFARDQPEYVPLPARVCPLDLDGCIVPDGRVVTEWQLTEEERTLIAHGENIRLELFTFGHPLQPIRLTVTTPEGD